MFAVLWAALSSLLVWAFPRIIAALGVYYVSNAVAQPIFNYLQAQVMNQFSTLGPDLLNVVYLSGLYDSVIIIFAAYTLALGIKGLRAIGKISST